MKLLSVLVFLAPVWAQSSAPLPDLPDETVVATFEDGVKMTLGEFKHLYAVLPPDNQQQAMHDRPAFLKQWALMRKLARLAEADQLDQLSPSKEALEYYRLVILSQAKMNAALMQTSILPSEVSAYFEANKDRYKQIRVKAIYIGYGGKITEAAALAKAEKIRAQIRAGAEFSSLVREYSDDETSRAKGGEFATLSAGDKLPGAVHAAIFQLKEGEVSEPVKQSNGLYLFRAEQIVYPPFSSVRDEIFSELKQKRYGEWLAKTNGDALVVFNNLAFIGAVPGDPRPKK
jgi:parvulin-like peptidyl-prolyl isomerase